MSDKSMFDILSGMDSSLFDKQDTLDDDSSEYPSSDKGDISKLIYDEDLPADVASKLLGADFDAACTYKLVSSYESTCVLKIDPRIPSDKPPVLDSTGRIIGGHMVEYPLTANDEVLSYSDMMSLIADTGKKQSSDLTYRRNIYDIPKANNKWFYIVVCMFLLLLGAGIGIMFFLSSLN